MTTEQPRGNAQASPDTEPAFLDEDTTQPGNADAQGPADTNSDDASLADDSTPDDSPVEWPADIQVPERLKGKSHSEIAREFASLHSDWGRLGQELGESRSLLREAVALNLMGSGKKEPDPDQDLTPEERAENERIDALVQRKLSPILQEVESTKLTQGVTRLETKHPGFQDTVKSPEFKQWVNESKYRQAVFKRANAYDFDAADELLDGYTEATKVIPESAADKARKLRSKSTMTGGGGGGKPAKSGKVYSAADIQRLYTSNRDRYNELLPEFRKAYDEGRVR